MSRHTVRRRGASLRAVRAKFAGRIAREQISHWQRRGTHSKTLHEFSTGRRRGEFSGHRTS
jgi:hypothetical protein